MREPRPFDEALVYNLLVALADALHDAGKIKAFKHINNALKLIDRGDG